jgi:hypothetical protein
VLILVLPFVAFPAASSSASECLGPDPDRTGTNAGETKTGGSAVNYWDSAGGDDDLYPLGNDDLICAGFGADRVEGGDGADLHWRGRC